MDETAYINILIDTLKRKISILDQLMENALSQEKRLSEENIDMKAFNSLLSIKGRLIERLNKLDDGFEKVYEHVKEELREEHGRHKEQVMILQELIKQIVEKSMKLQKVEGNNKLKLEIYGGNKRKEIKEFKVSRKVADSYRKTAAYQAYNPPKYFNEKN